MVQYVPRPFGRVTHENTTTHSQSCFTQQTERGASSSQGSNIDCWKVVRQKYLSEGYDADTVDILMTSWRDGTKNCYHVHLKRWLLYCEHSDTPFLHPTLSQVFAFFSEYIKNGCSYEQICTARSAMSLLLSYSTNEMTWGKLPIVKRYMKGVFERSPVFPKYYTTWDVSVVFSYFRELPSPSELDLKTLSQKLCLLLVLLSGGQRCQTIHKIQVQDLKVTNDMLQIPIMGKIKQTRPRMHMAPLKFKPYIREDKLCVVTHLKHYLQRTSVFRRSQKLFLSYIKPHSAVGKETIARWCKHTLNLAGIDINKYHSHSSRSAATSKANSKGMAVTKICEYAGWSNERTFASFYDKTIVENTVFQDTILPI